KTHCAAQLTAIQGITTTSVTTIGTVQLAVLLALSGSDDGVQLNGNGTATVHTGDFICGGDPRQAVFAAIPGLISQLCYLKERLPKGPSNFGCPLLNGVLALQLPNGIVDITDTEAHVLTWGWILYSNQVLTLGTDKGPVALQGLAQGTPTPQETPN